MFEKQTVNVLFSRAGPEPFREAPPPDHSVGRTILLGLLWLKVKMAPIRFMIPFDEPK